MRMEPSLLVRVDLLRVKFKKSPKVGEHILVMIHMEMALYRCQARLGKRRLMVVLQSLTEFYLLRWIWFASKGKFFTLCFKAPIYSGLFLC